MSSPANLDNAQAISARSSAAAGTKNTAALPCNASLHIGFFFDGFSRNLEDDLREDRLCNVGRLFLTHPYDQTTPPTVMSQMPQTQTIIKYFLVREFDSPDLTKTKGMAPDYLEQIKG